MDARRRTWILMALLCGALLASASVAPAQPKDSVRITALAPSTGKFGTVIKITLKGYVASRYVQLAMTMTSSPGVKCPTSYTKGFSQMSGLGNASGNAVSPPHLKKGKLDRIYRSKIDVNEPGTYGICAFLQVGSVTKAHAASSFTIVQ